MATDRKVQLVAEIQALLQDAKIAIATSYQGVSVAEQNALRAALTDAGVQFRVVKNTLLKRAADGAGNPAYGELTAGPTALAIGTEDIVSAAKALTAFLESRPNTPVQIRNAVVEGALVDDAYVRELASVPPRDELLARIAGGLVGKIRELMMLLDATTRDFAGLIEARAAQLEAEGTAA
ncbi:MAG: 50S ribosomal protein L10 [Dehalococcoidia bacterium]